MENQEKQDLEQNSAQPEGIEPIYKAFKDVPLKALDFFIGACLVAFMILLLAGVIMSAQNI